MADFLVSLVEMLGQFVITIPTILVSGIDFIVFILVRLPSIITNNMFSNLPFVFRYGLCGCLGVIILVTVLKIWTLIKA